MENKLISIYLTVCKYSSILAEEMQRFSNNFCPKFTDEEAITCLIFGITEQKLKVKTCYQFIKAYWSEWFPELWSEWFPELPSYSRFIRRINRLAPAIEVLVKCLIPSQYSAEINDFILDSMPIIVANSKRSRIARVASEICDKGYCASKSMYFYGVKLHSLVQSRPHKLPTLNFCTIEPASHSDITVGKQMLQLARNITVYADKAYADCNWNKELKTMENVQLYTPVKLKKGQKQIGYEDKLFSSAVSSVRQPIETFFGWLQEKTCIQFASKIRSTAGLLVFIFARIASVLF